MTNPEAREQLMNDIDSICESYFYSNLPRKYVDKHEDLTAIICDAVIKHFPKV